MEHHISIGEALRFGWEKTRAHSMLVFQVLLTMFAIQVMQQIVSHTIGDTLEGILADILLVVASVVIGIGFANISLKLAKSEHASYSDAVPSFNVCVSYIAANLLAAIVTVSPLIAFLIVIGIIYVALQSFVGATAIVMVVVMAVLGAMAAVAAVYLALRYVFVRYAILEDDDIGNSLRTSAKLTHGHKWWLLGFLVVTMLINLLGAILFLVGLLVTMPVTVIAYAHVYRQLRERHPHN